MDEARGETRRNTRNTKIIRSTRKHKYQADDNDKRFLGYIYVQLISKKQGV